MASVSTPVNLTPATVLSWCLYWVSWSKVFWMVVWAGLLPTVKAGSKVSMSPSTATTRVSRGVFEVDVDCALLAGEHAASRGSPTPNPRAATAPSFRTSRRVSKARRACTSSASSNRLRSLCLIRYLPNEVVAASFEAAVASCRASPKASSSSLGGVA